MTTSLFIASEHVRGVAECHRSIREKGTVIKAKSLFVGSLKISSKKFNRPLKKMPRIFATKIQWPEVVQGYSFTWAM